jgi:UDP-glucose 4-epimerase
MSSDLTELHGKRILITGGAGMIGSTVAHLAVEKGAKVTILDAMLPLYGGNMFNLHDIEERTTFIKGDIRDLPLLKQLVAETEIIFSLAAQVSYVDSNNDPFLDLDINCRGHLNLLEACREVNPEAKLVFASSRFVYGTIEYNSVDEKHPFNCLSIYGIHKLAGEKYYRFYFDRYGIKTVSLRIANPYGPRNQMKHSKYGIVNWFIRLALEGKPLTIYGDGSQVRDYIYVDDVARCIVLSALSDKTDGHVYNSGSGIGTPFIKMAETIAELVPGTEVFQLEWPKDRYFVETGDYVSNIDRLREATDWVPRYSLAEGISKTVEYYKKYHEHYW